MTNSTLQLPLLVVDAMGAEDATFFQEDMLTPLAKQLEELREGAQADHHLPTVMAGSVIDILTAFAGRRHIGIRSAMGFTTALGFLAPAPRDLPGFAPERLDSVDRLRRALTLAPGHFRFRGLSESDGLFVVLGALLLAAARALSDLPDGSDDIAEPGSILSSRDAARRFLVLMHGQTPTGLDRLAEKDRLKIRMVLDIVEPHLAPEPA